MAKYKKKPIVIEAALYSSMSCGLEDGFDHVGYGTVSYLPMLQALNSWYPKAPPAAQLQLPYIHTLEGKAYISKNDYILTGIKGERYPCKKDVFESTYELAEDKEMKKAVED